MAPLPDRWLDYTSVGKPIDGTPFLAFKVPLKNSFFQRVPEEHQFGPADLIQRVPNLSLVIDLTNTSKYYSENEFQNSGIQHEKIFCPGHEIPPKPLIKKFFNIVDEFMKKKSDNDGKDEVKLIGVHCTHGINRTGFFICNYLINKMGYNSEKAISEFNSARGHNIERVNYLKALKKYDAHPLEFSASELDEFESRNDYTRDDFNNRSSRGNPFHRRNPPENNVNSYRWSRPPRNDYRGRSRNPQTYHHSRNQRDSHYHRDHSFDNNARYGHSNWRNDSRLPFVSNYHSPLESVDPWTWYGSSSRSQHWNGGNFR